MTQKRTHSAKLSLECVTQPCIPRTWNHWPQIPVDTWATLERLPLVCDSFDWDWKGRALTERFTRRKESGRPSSHVQFLGRAGAHVAMESLVMVFSELRDCCLVPCLSLQMVVAYM